MSSKKVIAVDPEVHKELKVKAALAGIPIGELIKEYLEKNSDECE